MSIVAQQLNSQFGFGKFTAISIFQVVFITVCLYNIILETAVAVGCLQAFHSHEDFNSFCVAIAWLIFDC